MRQTIMTRDAKITQIYVATNPDQPDVIARPILKSALRVGGVKVRVGEAALRVGEVKVRVGEAGVRGGIVSLLIAVVDRSERRRLECGY
jgi:hypothetical protein